MLWFLILYSLISCRGDKYGDKSKNPKLFTFKLLPHPSLVHPLHPPGLLVCYTVGYNAQSYQFPTIGLFFPQMPLFCLV